MIKKKKSTYTIQAVGHALDVLEQFHDGGYELGITDLCRHLDLQKNKVFRLLATLEHHNFIEQNKATAGYRLGLKNLYLGQTFIKQMGLLRQARPVLESLTERCEETSYVATLKDFQTFYLDTVESELPVRVVSRVGKTSPFYCTDVGKILAAGVDDKNLREYIKSAEFRQFTPNTISDRDKLIKQMSEITALGYAVDNEEFDIGVRSVGAPIRDYTKRIIGAVSISAPLMRFTPERMKLQLIPLVKEAADEISMKLGYK